MKPVSTSEVRARVSTATVLECPPGARVGLEDDDVVPGAVELARRDQTRDPGAHDRDPAHRAFTRARRARPAGSSKPLSRTSSAQARRALGLGLPGPRQPVQSERGRRSCQKPLGPDGASGAASSQTAVSAPCAGSRSSGRASRVKRGSASVEPARAHPSRVHREDGDRVRAPPLGELLGDDHLEALRVRVEARAVEILALELEVVRPQPRRVHAARGDEDDPRAGTAARSSGASKPVSSSGPSTWVAMVSSWPCGVWRRSSTSTPALWSDAAQVGPRLAKRGREARTASRSERSHCQVSGRRRSGASRPRTRSAAASSRSRSRPTMCTRAPRAASPVPAASPMPPLAPVTITSAPVTRETGPAARSRRRSAGGSRAPRSRARRRDRGPVEQRTRTRGKPR